MTLEEYLDGLSDEKRTALVGCKTSDVRHAAFTEKRVVHAGLSGRLIAPEDYQNVWLRAMSMPPDGERTYTVYIHIPFCQTKCLYCGFYQNASRQEIEDVLSFCAKCGTFARSDTGEFEFM